LGGTPSLIKVRLTPAALAWLGCLATGASPRFSTEECDLSVNSRRISFTGSFLLLRRRRPPVRQKQVVFGVRPSGKLETILTNVSFLLEINNLAHSKSFRGDHILIDKLFVRVHWPNERYNFSYFLFLKNLRALVSSRWSFSSELWPIL
jgi:hypothetical protein